MVLEKLIRSAEAEGLTVPSQGAFLELEAVDETPAIGPEGRGRKGYPSQRHVSRGPHKIARMHGPASSP
jgi:hypothetical protein